MTGRHAAPPDEAFDQRERDRAGSHRADVDVQAASEAPPPAAPGRAKKAAPKKTTPPHSRRASKS